VTPVLAGTPDALAPSAPHIRDAISLRRVMGCVLVALVPALLMGLYNTGHQANAAMAQAGIASVPGWRGALLSGLGVGIDASSVLACGLHGLLYLGPVWVTTVLVGGAWERIFARVRGRQLSEGFGVIALLFALSLPPTVALWQVALGISFGLVVGREIFGGTGKNLLNPALAGIAFLHFAYPGELRAAAVWVPVDGYSGATALRLAASGGVEALEAAGITWSQAFAGRVPGAPGASPLAAALGAFVLLYTRVASWRVLVGALAAIVATSLLFNLAGDESLPMARVPWHWHLTLGSLAFGMAFFATDPVTGAWTDTGRWIYGGLIGALAVVIRIANPSEPEGVMLAVLLGNVFAPLIDYGVVWANIRRRARRG
jgi:Na+-transporting NADH:ubiquinone oxidoreductase subunit B